MASESLHAKIIENANNQESHRFRRVIDSGENGTHSFQTLLFAMQCNGYFYFANGEWGQNGAALAPVSEEFKAQRIVFAGPDAHPDIFNAYISITSEKYIEVFSQQYVEALLTRHRNIDENRATRLAFILGGIVRQLTHTEKKHPAYVKSAVDYVARIALLGEGNSVEAITTAMAMYVISGGSIEKDEQFENDIQRMSRAIAADNINPTITRDLGFFQETRLAAALSESGYPRFPTQQQRETFANSPTVGAEFHFSPTTMSDIDMFLKHAALLNMSQYNRKSYVQFARFDQGVFEVRMNPSDWPTTVANVARMKQIMPELNNAFFWITIRRPDKDFIWGTEDIVLLAMLQALGLLCYASKNDNIPTEIEDGAIPLGGMYLGQTVSVDVNGMQYTGEWGGGFGKSGQLSIYAGFGDNFTLLAYWLSMALEDPQIIPQFADRKDLTPLDSIVDLKKAINLDEGDRRWFFMKLRNNINRNDRLRKLDQVGKSIVDTLLSD